MEHSSIDLVVFESLALCDTLSCFSIFVLIKDFVAKGTTRAKFSMLWIIIASVYALFFQTLMSAMTGYSGRSFPSFLALAIWTWSNMSPAKTRPYIQIPPGGTQIPWSNMSSVVYIVQDGWRVGLTGNYLCTDGKLILGPRWSLILLIVQLLIFRLDV